MAYETGTATSPSDLLSKLAVFATANGWTANRNTAVTGGRQLCLQKGTDIFVNLQSYDNATMVITNGNQVNQYAIGINGSDQYDPGQTNVHRMTGYPRIVTYAAATDQGLAAMPSIPGPYPAYHFFAYGNVVYVVLEYTTGQFQHMGFGALDLDSPGAATLGNGRFTYGPIMGSGTNWTTFQGTVGGPEGTSAAEMVPFSCHRGASTMQLPGSFLRLNGVDSFNGWLHSYYSATSLTGASCHGTAGETAQFNVAPAPLNGVAVLWPIRVGMSRADAAVSPIGTMPNVRIMRMDNYLAGDEFSLGSDTWKVFPWYQKGSPQSLQRALAYLKA